MATLKSFKGFIPYELNLGRHYINGFVFTDDNNQSYYVSSEGSKAYLVSSNVVNYYPETCFPKVKRLVLNPEEFGMTLDELIDVTELEIKQNQIVNFTSPTLADAKTRTYELGERIRIEELDEVYECIEADVISTGYASGAPLEIGSDLYFVSFDASTHGQLYKKTSGVTEIVHQFDGGTNGGNPISVLITDSTYIYIETSQGGSNGLGALLKYNISTRAVTKILDFSSTIGFSNSSAGARFEQLQSNDKVIINGKLYMVTSSGGSNGVGTILSIDLSTNSETVIHNIATTPSYSSYFNASAGHAIEYNGNYVVALNNKIIVVDTSTDTISSTTVTGSSIDYLRAANIVVDGSFLYLVTARQAFVKYNLATNTIVVQRADNLSGSDVRSTYIMWKEGDYIYTLLQNSYDILGQAVWKWDTIGNTLVDATSEHPLLSVYDANNRPLNGLFNVSNNILYFTDGGKYNTQKNIKKYNVATKQIETIYDLQSSTPVASDDEYLIEIDQSATSNYYLRVRDNHTKSVVLDSLGQGLDITSTRGVTTNIPFPASASGEFWSYQYATNTTNGTALDLKALAGVKDFSDNLTLLSKTVSNSVFNGSELALEEGIYSIRINIGVAPEVAGNLIKFEVKDATAGTRVTEVMIDTNRLVTARHEATFDAILVDSTLAANGVTVAAFGIDTGGIRLNVFDIRIHITKIGDNI